MKCPFCQQELVRHWGMKEPALYCCDNPKCSRGGVATESSWQELIRTHKAFDVAVDGLLAVWRATDCTTKQGSIAYNVLRDLNIKPLDRIKALEQEDKSMTTIKQEVPYLYLIAYKAEMWNGGYERMSSEINSLVMYHTNNIFTEEDIQTLSRSLRSKLWKEHYEKLWGKQEGQHFGFGEGNLQLTILSITILKG